MCNLFPMLKTLIFISSRHVLLQVCRILTSLGVTSLYPQNTRTYAELRRSSTLEILINTIS